MKTRKKLLNIKLYKKNNDILIDFTKRIAHHQLALNINYDKKKKNSKTSISFTKRNIKKKVLDRKNFNSPR